MADRRELGEREEMKTKQMAYVHYNGSPVKDGGLANKNPTVCSIYYSVLLRSKNGKDRVEMRWETNGLKLVHLTASNVLYLLSTFEPGFLKWALCIFALQISISLSSLLAFAKSNQESQSYLIFLVSRKSSYYEEARNPNQSPSTNDRRLQNTHRCSLFRKQ